MRESFLFGSNTSVLKLQFESNLSAAGLLSLSLSGTNFVKFDLAPPPTNGTACVFTLWDYYSIGFFF